MGHRHFSRNAHWVRMGCLPQRTNWRLSHQVVNGDVRSQGFAEMIATDVRSASILDNQIFPVRIAAEAARAVQSLSR